MLIITTINQTNNMNNMILPIDLYAELEGKSLISTTNPAYTYLYSWSDWVLQQAIRRKFGSINYFCVVLQIHWSSLITKSTSSTTVATYNLVINTMTYYYLRRYWVGSLRQDAAIVDWLNIATFDLTPALITTTTDTSSQWSIPLLSPIAHYVRDHSTIFSGFTHPFHLVDPSPWPLATAVGLGYLTITTVAFFHGFLFSAWTLISGLVYLSLTLAFWWRDVIRESTYEFKHTPYVRRGLLLGIILFIISEVIFFFGFFWAFFHASLVPSQFIGGVWPPLIIQAISPWQLPLINTLCLLLSGVTLTIAHRQLNVLPYYNQPISLLWLRLRRLLTWLVITIALGTFFLSCQAVEYYLSPFTFQDTVFGGTFYILTGLHGIHVIVGTVFLLVCLWRASHLHFTMWKQVGFKAAVWYWHFVDVVWIFLWLRIYLWGA